MKKAPLVPVAVPSKAANKACSIVWSPLRARSLHTELQQPTYDKDCRDTKNMAIMHIMYAHLSPTGQYCPSEFAVISTVCSSWRAFCVWCCCVNAGACWSPPCGHHESGTCGQLCSKVCAVVLACRAWLYLLSSNAVCSCGCTTTVGVIE